jgi:hypothetical protein
MFFLVGVQFFELGVFGKLNGGVQFSEHDTIYKISIYKL